MKKGERNDRCVICGEADMVEGPRRDVPFGDLPGAVVEDVRVYDCPACGEEYIAFERFSELVSAFARKLLDKQGRLSGPEVRFLRSTMGWTGVDMAERMSVSPEQVSRWENGHVDISAGADRLLRALVALDKRIEGYSSDSLKAAPADRDRPDAKLRARKTDDGWIAVA